ncbi:MAG: SUF system Fe-S cluster assembly protein [Gammaproteobacteria bacterium]|nr:SUF system Fe-S cluster assembly protein [Gammaproteobacteria bacterium]
MNAPQEAPVIDTGTGTTLEEQIVSALRSVYDPEIPVNIYDLGLIYDLQIRDGKHVDIRMTLTAPACPVAGTMPAAVELAVKHVPGIETAHTELVWDPPWTQDRMSDAARLELGLL